MKTPITPLAVSALVALTALFSHPAIAEAYDIRLQAQRAIESITLEQRQAIHDQATYSLREQAEVIGTMNPPDPPARHHMEGTSEVVSALAPVPLATPPEPPKSATRVSKFGLPYFSFGKLTTSHRDK